MLEISRQERSIWDSCRYQQKRLHQHFTVPKWKKLFRSIAKNLNEGVCEAPTRMDISLHSQCYRVRTQDNSPDASERKVIVAEQKAVQHTSQPHILHLMVIDPWKFTHTARWLVLGCSCRISILIRSKKWRSPLEQNKLFSKKTVRQTQQQQKMNHSSQKVSQKTSEIKGKRPQYYFNYFYNNQASLVPRSKCKITKVVRTLPN